MSLNILHLSDLHLSNNTDADDLVALICNVSMEAPTNLSTNLSPNVIVVTGDIFDANDFSSDNYRSTIDKAVVFFSSLTSSFGISDFGEQLFFVPGNHEIYRQSIIDNKSGEELDRYREFLAAIYAEKWTSLVGDIYDEKHLCFVKHFEGEKTILVGLRSPRYEKPKRKDTSDNLFETSEIRNDQILTMHRKIKKINDYDNNKVIACLHNNIYNTVERNSEKNVDVTALKDNEKLLAALDAYNCCLILHGHKHQQSSKKINLSPNTGDNGHLCTIIGGGTFKESATDSFNYFEIDDKTLVLKQAS